MGKRAGFWIRSVAAMLDVAALTMVYIGCAVLYAAVANAIGDNDRAAVMLAVAIYASTLLYTSCEMWLAATPGKLIVGLRIRQQNGGAADRWRLFLRWQTKYYWVICSMLFALTGASVMYVLGGLVNTFLIIGCFFAANDDKLTWHDQWAGTAVYWRRGATTLIATPPPLPAVL
jgi:uncharacterized RDD family membrane protein YckC